MNIKLDYIVNNTKLTASYNNMTDSLLEEYIIRRFECSRYLAKQAVKRLRDEKNN